MDPKLQVITQFTQILTSAGVAAPIVFGLAASIVGTFRAFTGSAPSLLEVADAMEAQIDANDDKGQAEIARLKAMVSVG